MKIDLIFPPFWGDPSVPHIAIPAITSYLKKHGYDVKQWDVNLEALYYFFRDDTLEWAQRTIETRLNRKGHAKMDAAASERMIAALVKANYVRARIKPALDVFQSYESFVNMEAVAEAKEILNMALDLVSSAYHPTRMELFRYFGLDTRFSYERSSEILQAIECPEENPFVRFIENEGVIERLEERGTNFVGFSICNQVQLIPTLTIAKMIKQRMPGVKICLGGNIITRIREFILKVPTLFQYVDFWVVYEGEEPALNLLRSLEGEIPVESVPNLLYMTPDGPKATATRTGRDINQIDPPDYDDLPLNDYFQPGIILPYNCSVGGCYWRRCTFCEITGGYSDVFKSRNVDLIMKDLRYLCSRYNTNYIYFTDEAESPQRLGEVAEGIIRDGLSVRWMAMAKVDGHFSEAAFKTLFDSGCRVLMFGVESASIPVLKRMMKGTSPALYKKILSASHRQGIWTHAFFMFDFPTETYADAVETVTFIDENREIMDSIGSSQFELGLLTPVLSSPEKFSVEVLPNHPADDLKLFYEYVAHAGKSKEESDRVMSDVSQLKLSLYQRKGFPKLFGAAIGNSVNFVTLLLGRLADHSGGPEELPGHLSAIVREPRPRPQSTTTNAEGGTLILDSDLNYGLYDLRNGSDEDKLRACVMFHPTLPNQLKVLPVFTNDVLDVIKSQPMKPSEVLTEYARRTGVNEADLSPIGDFLVNMHSAGLIHVAC